MEHTHTRNEDHCPLCPPKEDPMACKCTPNSATQRKTYCPMHGCPHNDASQCDCRREAERYRNTPITADLPPNTTAQINPDPRPRVVSIEVGPGLEETSLALIDQLRTLGDQYGPTGVARAARALVRPPVTDEIATEDDLMRHPLESLLDAIENQPPSVPTSQRARDILEHAASLVDGDRNSAYGDARDNFTETGALWTVVLGPVLKDGAEITAEQVALCMAQVKVARLINNPTHADSWTDGCGYLGLGGGIAQQTAEESAL